MSNPFEELDAAITALDEQCKNCLAEKETAEHKFRELKGKMSDLAKQKEILTLLTQRNIDITGLEVIQGKLVQSAPGAEFSS